MSRLNVSVFQQARLLEFFQFFNWTNLEILSRRSIDPLNVVCDEWTILPLYIIG